MADDKEPGFRQNVSKFVGNASDNLNDYLLNNMAKLPFVADVVGAPTHDKYMRDREAYMRDRQPRQQPAEQSGLVQWAKAPADEIPPAGMPVFRPQELVGKEKPMMARRMNGGDEEHNTRSGNRLLQALGY